MQLCTPPTVRGLSYISGFLEHCFYLVKAKCEDYTSNQIPPQAQRVSTDTMLISRASLITLTAVNLSGGSRGWGMHPPPHQPDEKKSGHNSCTNTEATNKKRCNFQCLNCPFGAKMSSASGALPSDPLILLFVKCPLI